ncbi:hypothetical protein JCM30471_18970 [Desulfuromonas carbonis]|uniref:PilW family protein n=1 Tax=Desulfuromonas sp. DDH964 TaxID=1823759 RepID=UPI00078D839D|nr:prepilin-type N-terminal cleavage/methylation domain-containing protein [Desulfuromonas sp. DDH964]AMV73482.1 prepilin-type N-terminal cleavage/methylation domain-containing protein [Desulfuromonas sp. DDH964]
MTSRGQKGFSLIELLIVVAMMGLVVMAVYGLYGNTQRTAYTTEEVGEVQQNLRYAINRMSRDIRLTGFLVPVTTSKVVLASADTFSFRTASLSGAIGSLAAAPTVDPGDASGQTYIFTLAQPGMASFFVGPGNDVATRWARIVRPNTATQPVVAFFKVTNVDPDPTNPSLTLTGIPAGTGFSAGDIILPYTDAALDDTNDISTGVAVAPAKPGYDAPAPVPNLVQQVTYTLVDDTDSADPAMKVLLRSSSNEGSIEIAANITALTFSYLLEDGSEVATVTDPSAIGDIVGVRIVLTGSTDATKTGKDTFSGVKIRSLTTLVKFRN